MSRHGQPTLEHGETARTPREPLPAAEFEHEPGSYRWRAGDLERGVLVESFESTGQVFVNGRALTEPQLRGLCLSLQAAHSRAWPREDHGG